MRGEAFFKQMNDGHTERRGLVRQAGGLFIRLLLEYSAVTL